MKRKLLLFLGITSVGAIAAGFCLFLFKENIAKSALINVIEKKYPQSTVEIGNVVFDWGKGIKFDLGNVGINSNGKSAIQVQFASVQIQNLDYSSKKADVTFTIRGVEVDIDNINAFTTNNDLDKEASKEAPPEKLEVDKLNLKLNLDAKKIRFVSRKNNFKSDLLINDAAIKSATLFAPFEIALDLTANISNAANAAKVTSKAVLKVDPSQFTKLRNVNFDLKSDIISEVNKIDLPKMALDLKSDLLGLNKLKGEVSVSSDWLSFSSNIAAELSKEDFQAQDVRISLHPSHVIKNFKISEDKGLSLNDEAEIILLGSGKNLLKDPEVDVSFHSENFNNLIFNEKNISLWNFRGSLIADKKLATGKVEYGQSNLTGEAQLHDGKPIKAHAEGSLVVGDLESFLSAFAHGYQLQTKESRIEFKSDITFEEEKVLPTVEIVSHDKITIENSDRYKLTLSNFVVTASHADNKISYSADAQSEINVPGQPILFASFHGNGELKDQEELTAKIDLNSWTSKNKSSSGTTNAHLILALSKGNLEIEKLNGEFYIKDIAPFIPRELRQKLRGLEASKACLLFNGSISFIDNKLTKSIFMSELKNELQLNYDGNKIKMVEFTTSLEPIKTSDSLPLRLELKSLVSKEGSSDILRLSLDSKIDIDLAKTIEKKKLYSKAKNNLKLNSKSFITSDFGISDSRIIVSNIDSRIDLSDFISFVPPESRKIFQSVNKNVAAVELKGNAEIKQEKIANISIVAKSIQPISLILPENIPASLAIEANITNESMSFSGDVTVLNGKVSLSGRSDSPKNFKNINLKTVFPKIIKSKVSDVRISKDLIRKLLYKPAVPIINKGPHPKISEKSDYSFAKSIPPFKTIIENSSFFVEQAKFNLQGDMDYKENVFQSTNIKFAADTGTAAIKVKGTIEDTFIKMTVKTEISKFNLSSFNAFLPPIVETVTGEMNGGLTAVLTYSPPQETQYRAEFETSFKNGEIRQLNLTEKVKGIVSKFDFAKSYADKIKLILTDKFEHLVIKGKANEKVVVLDEFDFIGIKNSVSLKGKGYLGQPSSKQKSELNFSLADLTGQVAPLIKSNTGLDRIPVKLTGTELDLSPDVQYTLGEVGGGAVKVQAAKQGEKLMKSLENKASDFLGNLLGGKKKKK